MDTLARRLKVLRILILDGVLELGQIPKGL